MPEQPEGLAVVLKALEQRSGQAGVGMPLVSKLRAVEPNIWGTRVFHIPSNPGTGDPCGYYAKFYDIRTRGAKKAQKDAENEFEALELLWRHMRGVAPRISVAEPVLHMPEYACVVTRESPGRTLHELIHRKASLVRPRHNGDIQALERAVKLYVEWLTILQGIVTCREQVYPAEKLSSDFDFRLGFCLQEGYVAPDVAERLKSIKQASLEYLATCRYDAVGSQLDAGPENVLVTPEGVCLIDFTEFGYRHMYRDICDFWRALRPVNPLVDMRIMEHLRSIFMQEVRQRFSVDEKVLTFFMISAVVNDGYNTARISQQSRLLTRSLSVFAKHSFRTSMRELAVSIHGADGATNLWTN